MNSNMTMIIRASSCSFDQNMKKTWWLTLLSFQIFIWRALKILNYKQKYTVSVRSSLVLRGWDKTMEYYHPSTRSAKRKVFAIKPSSPVDAGTLRLSGMADFWVPQRMAEKYASSGVQIRDSVKRVKKNLRTKFVVWLLVGVGFEQLYYQLLVKFAEFDGEEFSRRLPQFLQSALV